MRRGTLRGLDVESNIKSFQTAAGKNRMGLRAAAAERIYLILINTDVEPEMISSMLTDHSPAADSRNNAEFPGSLFWSRTLIWDNGASGSSLSSTSSVGVGLSSVT